LEASAPAWFRKPGPDFQPATFWFWHRIPTEQEIVAQLSDMRAKGIGTVMIQARRALPLDDYLSSDYLAAYGRAADEMHRLRLRLGIYDEYCWMSGHGGGRTVAGADHLRERHLFWSSASAGGGRVTLRVSNIRSPFHQFLGEAGATWCYEGGTAIWSDWQPVTALLHPFAIDGPQDIVPVSSDRIGIAPAGEGGCEVVVDVSGLARPGEVVTVFVAARCATSRMINYLLAEAAERFAERVYEPLLTAAGGRAHSVFFDHPYAGFYVWDEHHGDLGNSLLWDEALSAADPSVLLSLIHSAGPQTASDRASFFTAYQSRLHEAFFGTLGRWCSARGVAFTGHELLTHVGAWGLQSGLGGIDPRSMPGVDYFGVDAYRDVTAVDAADYRPQLSAKFGDSVARANGRKRCTIEQYSTGRETGIPGLAGQWGLTAERFRAQSIRHLLSGARQILLHAVNVTDGWDEDETLLLNPRFDFPPGFNFEPWWEDCPEIFTELARLSSFLEDGAPLRPVALFYPLETLLAEASAPACAEHFGWWAKALFEQGTGFDIVDERSLHRTLSPDGSRTTLILPGVTTVASVQTMEIITAFVTAGGRLLFSGQIPARTRQWGGEEHLAVHVRSLLQNTRVTRIDDADELSVAAAVAALPRPQPDLKFETGSTPSAIARCGDAWRLAAFNDEAVARTLDVLLPDGATHLTLWESDTGEMRDLGVAAGKSLRLSVGPHVLLCLSARSPDGCMPLSLMSDGEDAPVHRVALADGWTLEIDGHTPRPIDVDRGWELQGWPVFAGTGIYRRRVALADLSDGEAWHLELPGVRDTVDVRINGLPSGRRIAGDACFELPDLRGEVGLELHVRNTAANRFYAGTSFLATPEPSGLTQPPVLVRATKGFAAPIRVIRP
jgi:hypothetical protein